MSEFGKYHNLNQHHEVFDGVDAAELLDEAAERQAQIDRVSRPLAETALSNLGEQPKAVDA